VYVSKASSRSRTATPRWWIRRALTGAMLATPAVRHSYETRHIAVTFLASASVTKV
jgi:hypothetical protein